jgi:hypothetical protein
MIIPSHLYFTQAFELNSARLRLRELEQDPKYVFNLKMHTQAVLFQRIEGQVDEHTTEVFSD